MRHLQILAASHSLFLSLLIDQIRVGQLIIVRCGASALAIDGKLKQMSVSSNKIRILMSILLKDLPNNILPKLITTILIQQYGQIAEQNKKTQISYVLICVPKLVLF